MPFSATRTRESNVFSALLFLDPRLTAIMAGPSKEHFEHWKNGMVPVRPAGRLATEKAFLGRLGLSCSLTAPLQKPWRLFSVGRRGGKGRGGGGGDDGG